MAGKQIVLTPEGLEKLKEELEYLKIVKRKEITEKIKEARGFGDLSENSEYDAAKEAQAAMEQRVMEIENILQTATVIDVSDIPNDVVSIGSYVKVFACDIEEEEEYTIVGSTESDPLNNKISDESPIGRGLLGRKIGETVEIETPNGVVPFKILEIQK
ncbi:MAG: transcription elongation factor GreA [Clostridia bacterium]|nr:transcription elongation factor GreA [Clostridia bacterium]